MRSATYQLASDEGRARLSRRGVALLVVIVVHCLLIGALIYAAKVRVTPPIVETAMQVFNILPPAPPQIARAPVQRAKASGGAAPRARTRAPVTVKPPPTPPLVALDTNFDLSKIPKVAETQTAGTTEGVGVGKSVGPVYGPVLGKSTGPGGQTLYAAEWYRRPTHAEMSTYMPRAPENSWAEVACRTIERSQVEDCVELDESPHGSGLSRGLRQAAWQFRIRPPRIDGKPQIGTWVRIHIDFTQVDKEGEDDEAEQVARKYGPER